MKRFPDWLTIQAPGSGGSRDPNTGRWIPAQGTAVYDGPASFQDEGVQLEWSNGQPVRTSDVKAFLPRLRSRFAIPHIKPSYTVKMEWGRDGSATDGQVSEVKRMGTCIYIKYV